MQNKQLKGLYAITDRGLTPEQELICQVEQALAGGASIIQYRDKGSDPERRREEATTLLRLCRDRKTPLIINDDLDLAASIGADGVHLGRNDPDLPSARKQLGPDNIIGVSCYNRLELALQAAQQGADYVAFGCFFPSRIKPYAVQANIALLQKAHRALKIPIVAIGGITPENGRALIEAGADMLAVIYGLFGQSDIRAACHSFTQLFEQPEDSPS